MTNPADSVIAAPPHPHSGPVRDTRLVTDSGPAPCTQLSAGRDSVAVIRNLENIAQIEPQASAFLNQSRGA